MKTPEQHPDNLDPVSRKTNEEIDSDQEGNLIIGGQEEYNTGSLPSDGPISKDRAQGNNSLAEQETSAED